MGAWNQMSCGLQKQRDGLPDLRLLICVTFGLFFCTIDHELKRTDDFNPVVSEGFLSRYQTFHTCVIWLRHQSSKRHSFLEESMQPL